MNLDEYLALDATALAEAIRRGDVSAETVVGHAIEATERVNPRLNAIVNEDFAFARTMARHPVAGRFVGVPTFVKDNDDLTGLPTRNGSLATPNRPAARTSNFVKKILLPMGFIPLAKTTMPEFGLTGTTEPLLHPPTRNPFHNDHTPGGSSGGSATLVAAGAVPVAHGNDGGGSIRIPAAFCGLVGLKCTRGRLPGMDGTEAAPVDIVSQGIVSRTVRDTAAFFEEAEKLHPTSLPAIGRVEGPGQDRLRIAFFTTGPEGSPCEPSTVQATIDAANTLASLGHKVEEIDNPFPASLHEDFLIFWGFLPFMLRWAGRFVEGRDFDFEATDDWTKGLARFFGRNAHRSVGAIRRLRRSAAFANELFRRHDLLLSPVLTVPPLEIGTLHANPVFEEVFDSLKPMVGFTPYHNAMGTPAMSLPLGLDAKGLPRAVQIAANHGMERRLLEVASEFEAARPWAEHYPSLDANA